MAGSYELAVFDLSKSLEMDATNANAYWYRGFSYYKRGLKDRAVEDFNKAREINASYASLYYEKFDEIPAYTGNKYESYVQNLHALENLMPDRYSTNCQPNAFGGIQCDTIKW